MTMDEITRITNRLDSIEARWNDNILRHEDTIKEDLRSHKHEIKDVIVESNKKMMWMFGLIFSVAVILFGFFGEDHLGLKSAFNELRQDFGIVVGKINFEHPGYVIEDLNSKYNPKRGIE